MAGNEPDGKSPSPPEKPATRSLAEALDFARLSVELEEFEGMTPEQQEAALREAGYDEGRLRKRIEEIRAKVYETPR